MILLSAIQNLFQIHCLKLGVVAIDELSEYPERIKLVDDLVLSSWNIRFVIVKNYLAFYKIDYENNLVIIVRFLYQKSAITVITANSNPI